MRRAPRPAIGVAVMTVTALLRAASATAHHEALFGPQSSATLSQDGFLTVQVFSRELGPSGERTRETTGVVSAGMQVTKRLPITVSITAPYSWIRETGASNAGAEDLLLGVRYRHDLKGLQDRWDREGNFVSGMAAVELNNGTIDHPGWDGPVEAMGGALASFERGPWSLMGYAVGRANRPDDTGSRDGNTLFAGTGVAYTPNENLETGRLISYQAGVSWEHYARDRTGAGVVASSGGSEVLVHPAIAYTPGHNLLFVGIGSVPAGPPVRDPAARTRYRVGTGIIYGW